MLISLEFLVVVLKLKALCPGYVTTIVQKLKLNLWVDF